MDQHITAPDEVKVVRSPGQISYVPLKERHLLAQPFLLCGCAGLIEIGRNQVKSNDLAAELASESTAMLSLTAASIQDKRICRHTEGSDQIVKHGRGTWMQTLRKRRKQFSVGKEDRPELSVHGF